MTPFFVTIYLLGLSSLATAANFKPIFQWNELDYEWPPEVDRKQEAKNGIFNKNTAKNIKFFYMAVYGTRLFLSLQEEGQNLPATLVSLPTSGASYSSPKLTPFPSWDMHDRRGDCYKISNASGLEVDSVGRLWVLDDGSDNCSGKIWTIDLKNNDQTKLVHQFSQNHEMRDIVLDETPNGTFAYISRWGESHIVVFNLERNESWIVDTPGIKISSIALSPKDQESRLLYLSKSYTNELYSLPVALLRDGTQSANPKLIKEWTSRPYRMLIDNQGKLFAAFFSKSYLQCWDTYQPFVEKRLYEIDDLNYYWPFTFALDQNGTFWTTVRGGRFVYPRYRLIRAAIGAQSYIFEVSTVRPRIRTTTTSRTSHSTPTTTKSSTPAAETTATTELQAESCILTEIKNQHQQFLIKALICLNVFTAILSGLIILWLILHQKRNYSPVQNSFESLEMSKLFRDNHDEVSTSEELKDE